MSAASTSAPKPAIQRGKITWPDESSIKQNFSLPSSIIYYISKNPSNPTIYLKFAQSSKYFFEKLPILVTNDFYGESTLCSSSDNEECKKNGYKCCTTVNLTKLTSQIWLTHGLYVNDKHDKPNYIFVLPKIYRSNVSRLYIRNEQILFNDFKFMALSAKTISIIDAQVIFQDGNTVPLDVVLEALPNVENFICRPPTIISSTLKHISKFQNLHDLKLFGIPEIGQVNDFMEVIQKLKHTKIRLLFLDNISEGFMNQLNALIDTVIKAKSIKCVIRYNGQDVEKFEIMENRYSIK